jgi:hypothetical protein
MTRRLLGPALCALALTATTASAGLVSDPAAAGFQPRVPISLLARPMQWFDSSRLQFSNTVTVGAASGWGTSALNVTSLTYQFQAPVTMQLRLGTQLGGGFRSGNQNPFFVEGLDMTWRPGGNTTFRVQWRDVRSPLQYPAGYGPGHAAGPLDPWYGAH